MKVFVTGSAGFIGSYVVQKLLSRGDYVVGLDNHNNYYDPLLKEARIAQFLKHERYTHKRIDLCKWDELKNCFKDFRPDKVVHLAAQAGVRYSMENPFAFIQSNINAFGNILEGCIKFPVQHLVYASTSSVYGGNSSLPYSTHQNTNHPLSLYAATKKSNELMAHAYSHLYGLHATGIRFFTVYGPWGRPDMALFKFTHSILNGIPIQVYNYGNHKRDFTYIDDIVEGIIRILDHPASANINWNGDQPDPATSNAPWRLYNIGNSTPVKLLDYISALEISIGREAQIELFPLQPGDVLDTFADVGDLRDQFGFHPSTSVKEGVENFVNWYRNYYRL